MTHFTRLIELTSADEAYIAALAQTLAPCILRPRAENSLTLEEKHSYRLIRDLFVHKSQIFSELKRASSLSHSANNANNRPRAISTDESNRKANMEARTRAILAAGGSRSRATSPAPSPRGHRRDRSSGGPETRFPIQTSPTLTSEPRNSRGSLGSTVTRASLDIPGSIDSISTGSDGQTAPSALQQATNGVSDFGTGAADAGADEGGLEKRNSLGRPSHPVVGRLATARKPPASSSLNRVSVGGGGKLEQPESRPQGVSLTDKVMDD